MEVHELAPSHPKILKNCTHLFLSHIRFFTTTGQSFLDAVRTLPRQLNEFTTSGGHP